MKEILDIYPKVKGLQILDDEGKPMFPSTKGQWLQDTPAQRTKILSTIGQLEGLQQFEPRRRHRRARCRAGGPPTRKISVYVDRRRLSPAVPSRRRFRRCANTTPWTARDVTGFAFTPSACPMVRAPRRLSISAFAALMRAMCDDNEGTFVGLTIGGASCAIKVDVFWVQPRCVSWRIATRELRRLTQLCTPDSRCRRRWCSAAARQSRCGRRASCPSR